MEEKDLKYNTVVFTTLLFMLVVVGIVHASSKVVVEYFYVPGCPECEAVNPLIKEIESRYVDQVSIEWVDVVTPEGFDRLRKYNFTEVPAVVINHEYRMSRKDITEEKLKEAIEAYIYGGKLIIPKELYLSIPVAFSLGLFSGFSPCLMAMLAFILALTSTSTDLKGGLVRALIFGLGLVAAYLLMGAFVLVLRKSFTDILAYLNVVTWAVSAFMILAGLNLLDLLKFLPSTKPLVQRLARKYGTSFGGLFALGVLFSFIKVPCAAPFFLILLARIVFGGGTLDDLMLLLFFSLGVLIPFLAVGLVGGGAPTLAKKIREQYRSLTRKISGFILIGLGIWLLIL